MYALGDGFASPLFLEAMNRHRAACMEPGETTCWSLNQRSGAKDHDHVHRWEPWVRSYLCAQTLMSNLKFQAEAGSSAEASSNSSDVPLIVTMDTCLPGADKRHVLVTLVRPPEAVFRGQVQLVLDWADLREERLPEIVTQIANTYAFWGALVPLHTERMRHTREVLDAAVQFAMFVEMQFKHELACWRPVDYSPQVQPVVTTPGHGALPSGHCVEAYVIKEVLEGLLGLSNPQAADQAGLHAQFERTAARIATNRVVAGVHFPIDNVAGRLLGTVLGRYFVFFCGGAPENKQAAYVGPSRTFDGQACPPGLEFMPDRQPLDDFEKIYTSDAAKSPFPSFVPPESVLTVLWRAARKELDQLQLPFL
jgi:membrane-associated phospholipid phosphatase